MNTMRSRGFTLIELLTVIAIIAILTAMTAVTLPKVLEKAKVTATEADFKAVEKALATYAADHGSYPPGLNFQVLTPDGVIVFPQDYMTTLKLKDVKGVNDRWTDGTVPFVYIPVNVAQFNKVKKAMAEKATLAAKQYCKGPDATFKAPDLGLSPPPTFDAYVLISVGPNGVKSSAGNYTYAGICYTDNASNLVADPDGDAGEKLEVSALRAYFRATRDANNNQELDFDWRARTRQNEAKPGNFGTLPTQAEKDLCFHLPNEIDPSTSASTSGTGSGPGPLIFASPK